MKRASGEVPGDGVAEMFTGIVQTMGAVQSIRHESSLMRLTVDAPDLPRPINLGASVCVSGVCLTVTAADERSLSFDIIPETLARSTLGGLQPGSRVNLEPSLRAGDRMDGHVVQGHVDGVARVAGIAAGPQGHVVRFEAPPELMVYMIAKGSVAVDGVSLTIAAVTRDAFSVALIPTTLAVTTLGALEVGAEVNIETDIVARTVVATLERWRGRSRPSMALDDTLPDPRGPSDPVGLSSNSLRENGW